MGLFNDMVAALDKRDAERAEAHRRWLDTPEGRRRAAEWQAEDSRMGDR